MNRSTPEVRSNTADDEAIAFVLQEELTELAAHEVAASDTGCTLDDGIKAAVLSQAWHDNAVSDNKRDSILGLRTAGGECDGQSCGIEGGYPESVLTRASQSFGAGQADSMGPRKQGPSSGSKVKTRSSSSDYDSYEYDEDDDLTLALALSEDEHRFDEEVARRLKKLDSIRHVPRINADVMPTLDAASVDHARLLERLVLYGLNEQKIQGDGNCQFRALSDQLYRTPEHHKFVRKTIVTQLEDHPDVYSGYVPMAYSEYLKKMAKTGEWGDHVTLQAAADCYGVKIWLITSFKDTTFIEILPYELLSNRG